MALPEENPVYSPFFGVMGAAAAIIFSGKRKHCPFYHPIMLVSPKRGSFDALYAIPPSARLACSQIRQENSVLGVKNP